MKRLRSTRMDKQLSTTIKKARTSRIIDGPEGLSTRPGSAGADGSDRKNNDFKIIEDRDAPGKVEPILLSATKMRLRLMTFQGSWLLSKPRSNDQTPTGMRRINWLEVEVDRPSSSVGISETFLKARSWTTFQPILYHYAQSAISPSSQRWNISSSVM